MMVAAYRAGVQNPPMPWHTVTYKRDTLYDQVWSEPIRTVAQL
jgi:hypothetical protein